MDYECPYWSELDKHKVGCPFRDCKHNMYWEGLNIKNPTDTERFKEFKNCMLLLDESITLEDIGQAYGISRERVRQVEERSLWEKFFSSKPKKIRKCLRCDRDFSSDENRICPSCTNRNSHYDGVFTGQNTDGIYL